MLEHGGRLRAAARQYGIPLADWVDLSTGINPQPWPVPALPASVWQRLPEDDDGLADTAAAYYGSAELLPVAGSQAAIQALPAVLPGTRISILSPIYAEHPHAWRGRELRHCTADALAGAVPDSDIVVLANPNNPTGQRFGREQLLAWHADLAARGGWLVVDEAFIDVAAQDSLAASAGRPGLVVLRSLGKFFGLAGARVGFLLAPPALRRQLAALLGPWALSGPAREVARLALADAAWQAAARQRLTADGARLAALLRAHLPGTPHGTALFQTLPHPGAARLHHALARRGILVRLFEQPAALRFGLPPDETGWQRLAAALPAALNETLEEST
jgi:cobalamin biosynthesis protein CobC